jgi:predicted amidohydrolase
VNICLIQTDPGMGRENIRTLRDSIRQIDADLYVVPEVFATGFDLEMEKGPVAPEAIPGGLTCRQVQGFLKDRNKSAAVCGLLEQNGHDLYNVALVITADQVFTYRQKFPNNQGRAIGIVPGEHFVNVSLPSGQNIGLMVCSDYNWAADLFAEYHRKGAQTVVLIADSRTQERIKGFPQHCQQYRLSAIVCNAAGEFKGGSCIINAAGQFISLNTPQGQRDRLPDTPMAAIGVL